MHGGSAAAAAVDSYGDGDASACPEGDSYVDGEVCPGVELVAERWDGRVEVEAFALVAGGDV